MRDAGNIAFVLPILGEIYNVLAQAEDPYRNPVILIPGTMGSRLVDQDTDEVVYKKNKGPFPWISSV